MNIRDLQYLVSVYDLGSFSKAANACFVSQPTLSGQLKKLEEQLGAPLIERTTRKLLFTQLGEETVLEARSILKSVKRIKQLATENDDPMAGDFHIGFIPTIGPYLLPRFLPSLTAEFPQMNVFLYELKTDQLIEAILNGDLDAGILAKLDWNYPLTEFSLYDEELLLAIQSTDPVSVANTLVERSILHDRNVLMLEDGHCLRDQALGVCFSEGAKEDSRFQATSIDTLLHMVSSGAGVTLVPELAGDRTVSGVDFHRFKHPAPKREVVMLSRKKSVKLSACKILSELIRSNVPCK